MGASGGFVGSLFGSVIREAAPMLKANQQPSAAKDEGGIGARDAAKRRQAAAAATATARRSTLLTGPEGVADQATGGQKTLLGM